MKTETPVRARNGEKDGLESYAGVFWCEPRSLSDRMGAGVGTGGHGGGRCRGRRWGRGGEVRAALLGGAEVRVGQRGELYRELECGNGARPCARDAGAGLRG